ncbi:MAG TPA: nucleotidyltransferase domain-containing protein [Candidatus Nanoarchaeia archaeon]|nr:nucleotidyltransferase domain-containing protein [Candidatus Nanoarchaeia archaeon]
MVDRKTSALKQSPGDLFLARERILYWFFAYPDSDWTFTEICEQTRTAKKTAMRIVDELFKNKFIKKNELGRSWRLMAETSNPAFVRHKITANFSQIYGSTLVDQIQEAYPQAKAIILFGSFRKGEDVPGSDLDIAVEIQGAQPPRIEQFSTMTFIGYRPNVPVNVLVFSRNAIDINLFSNIVNGIVLDGFLEAKP